MSRTNVQSKKVDGITVYTVEGVYGVRFTSVKDAEKVAEALEIAYACGYRNKATEIRKALDL